MQIWFCQSCGARVTQADLGNVAGMTATSLVYCKDCLKKEKRIERVDDAANTPPSRRRVSTKNVRRKSTGKVAHVVVAPEPEPEPVEEEDEDLRRARRARHSGSNLPRAASNKIRIAAASGILLLITGVVMVNVNLSPEPPRVAAPPHRTVDPDAQAPRRNDDAPAQQAFNELEQQLKKMNDNEPKAKLAAIDAFLKKFGDSIVAARARTLRQKYVIADATVAVPANPLLPAEARPAPAKVADPSNSDALPLPMTTKIMISPVEVHNAKALELLNAGDLRGAVAEFDRSLKLDPNDKSSLIARSELHRLLYEFQECFEDADRLVTLDEKSWGALAMRAVSAYAIGKENVYKVDVANCVKAMKDMNVESQRYLLNWLQSEAPRSRAIFLGINLEKHGPKTGKDHYIMAYYYFQTGKFKEADDFGRKALELDPTLADNEVYLFLILVAEARGDFKTKLETARTWAQARPKDTKALNNYAWELLCGGDPALHDNAAGLEVAQRAVDLAPNEVPILDTYALACFNNNLVQKAIENEKRAVSLLGADEDKTLYTQHLEQYEFAKPPEP